MFAANYLHYLKSICLVVILGCLFTSNSSAQDASNKRGFQPGNSFSIGDFETINTTNGNLMFKFPLAGLPAGRNGLTAGINLYYSSKVLDSQVRYFDKLNSCVHNSPDCPYYKKVLLKESDQGGWHFGMGYSLKVIDRREEFVYVPVELQPTCSISDPRYFEMRYHIKLILNMPDGSTHEMRPNGWTDGNFNDPLGDYFEISPDGFWFDCNTSQWYTNTITYYSIDGSFLRLDIQHDGNTAGGWQDNPWTLYFPDGSKVTTNQPNNEPQRFYDRNDNYVEFVGNTIRDQFNRSISISSGTQNGKPVNTITSQGFGETLTWTVQWKTISVLKNYWPCEDWLACDPEIPQQEPYGWLRSVVDTITLPTQAGGLTYTFSYNAPDHSSYPLISSIGWGEVNGVTLPSGAHIDYQYAQDGSQPYSATPDVLRNSPTSKVLTYNQEYNGTSTPVTETWSYGITQWGSSVTAPDGGTTTTDFFDTSAASWGSGLTYRSVGPDGAKTETIWARNDLATGIASNSYPKTVFTSIKNASGTYVKTAIKDYKYDKNGNVTRIAEYDWLDYQSVPRDGQGLPTGIPSVSPTRVTVNTYFNSTPDATQFAGSSTNVYWSSGSPRVKHSTASTEVRRILTGGAEDPVTRVDYTYDNAAAPANLTQMRTWDSTKGAYTSSLTAGNSLTATTQYNQYGMPTLVTGPRGLKTLTTYGQIGTVSDLYPTQIKAAYQSSEERTETREYDFGTGLTTRVTDNNNNVSTVTSYDALGRPTLVRLAEGKSEETRTATEYSETARRVITRADLSTAGDGKLVSIQHYDQLGRVRLTRELEDAAQSATDEATGIKVQTRYRYSGANSYVLVSNAYRAATSNAAGSETTMGWTRSKFDIAGKAIEVQTFSGATLPAPWDSNTISTGTVTTAYDANFTTVTDQAQKSRRSVTDALGRLIRVDEPDLSGNLGSTAAPVQPTDYSYDVLGNLTHVTQSDGTTTQNRNFNYSSLSLLTASTQPENGTISYKYDASGNPIVKTDARNVSIHFAYDALNRVTRRWYNGSNSDSATTHNSPALPSGVSATDEVKFYYDSQSLPQGAPTYTREYTAGRLVAQTYGTGTNGDYFSYDALGRTKLKYQQTGAINYRMIANYNLASAVTLLTYPSDHRITNSLDTIGRLLSVAGNLGVGGGDRTYTSGILYTPGGALTKEQFGTNTAVYNKQFYNSRGQLAEIRVSTGYTGPTDYTADRGAIVNAYSSQCAGICIGSSMTDNNGNLKKQEIHIPGYQMRWQQFDYDTLNRLDWVSEVLDGGAEQWKQKFTYDRFGNRTINTGITYGGINEKEFAVNTANNRLGVQPGQSGVMDYDLAGNLTNDTYTGNGNRTYDAENRITSAWGGNNQAQLYGYDGSGQRVKRTVDGVTTWQVYGLGNELLAEYADNGSAASPQKEYGYRNGELLVTASAASRVNFARSTNGATVTAQNYTQDGVFAGYHFYPSSVIDGQRYGHLIAGGGDINGFWRDEHGLPSWLEVNFNGSKTIDEIDVFTVPECPACLNQSDPSPTQTFSQYAVTGFEVQYWTGSSWATVPGGSISGNNLVWRKLTFSAITTSKIRVMVTAAATDGVARIAEIEAWGSNSVATNVALSTNGATATAQNYTQDGVFAGYHFYPSAAIDGQRYGHLIAGGGDINGFWRDEHGLPSWLEVNFNGSKTIEEIDVFLVPECPACLNQADPSPTQTFSQYGATGFEVQYWTGSSWATVPGGSISGNNLIWRKFTFTAITTSKIRVMVTAAATDGVARINEIEAWTTSPNNNATVNWLVSDQLGTPRMILDESGSSVKRHDYLPFGEELIAPYHGRTSSQGYVAGDGVRQQFTSQERDFETGLDYFGARFYSSVQGRFTSPDPLLTSAKRGQPQSWNRYTYCLNSPYVYIDLLGLVWAYVDSIDGGGKVTRAFTWYDKKEDIPSDSTLYESHYASVGTGPQASVYLGDSASDWRYITRAEYEHGTFQEIADDINRGFREAGQRAEEQAAENSWFVQFAVLLANRDHVPSPASPGAETFNDYDEHDQLWRVRHYTSVSGRRGIQKTGTIIAYDQNSVFTVNARGRRMSPRDVEERLGIARGRGNAYVDFSARRSEFTIIQRETGVREFVFKGDVNLTDRNPTFHLNK